MEALLEMPRDQLTSIGKWLSNPSNPVPLAWSQFGPMAAELGLSIGIINQAMPLIQFVMANWRSESLELRDVIADLNQMELDEHLVENGKLLFGALESSQERFFIANLRGQAEIIGMPSLDDVQIFWDIRPIFQEPAFQTGSTTEAVSRWLTNIYVLIAELSCSYRDGKRETLAIQLSETTLDELQNALDRAKKQLEVLKRKQFV